MALLGIACCALPPVLALLTRRVLALAWLPACVLFLLLAARARPRWGDFAFLHSSFCFLAATLLVGIVFLMPYADSKKTTAPFFDAIRRESSGVELFTTFRDDRSLPLITYSLGRRVKVISEGEVFGLFARGKNVGVITSPEFYQANRQRMDGLRVTHIEAPRGKEIFSYLGRAAGSAFDAPDQ
jgi:hypothetical protein